jgi:hypothetical protein
MVFGAANVDAGVRIGGDVAPNSAAILDLKVNKWLNYVVSVTVLITERKQHKKQKK